MIVQIEIAWIAAGSVVAGAAVGVAGAVIAARLGLRSGERSAAAIISANSSDIKAQIDAGSADVRAQLAAASVDIKAQIEADRSHRIWEKQAAAYTDAIEGIFHRQRIRRVQFQSMIASTDPPLQNPAPVNWSALEARLITFSPQVVIKAFQDAGTAGSAFEYQLNIWRTQREELRQQLGAHPGQTASVPSNRAAVEEALDEVNRLDDVLMDTIREELHAGAAVARAQPVPLAPPPRPV